MATDASFLGLGKMGIEMAQHLSRNGFSLTVWNRTNIFDKNPEAAKHFSSDVKVADSALEALKASKTVLLMLWDAASVHEVLSCLSDEDYKDRLFVSHVTISPQESRELFQLISGKGGKYLEAPVLGNNVVAAKGALQTLVGGERELFNLCEKMFASWGTPRYIGAVGTATATKLSLNSLLGANVLAFATAYGYLDNVGADMDMFLTILTHGPFNLAGGYFPFGIWAEKFKQRKYDQVAFSSQGLAKDLVLAADEFERAGITAPTTKAMAEITKEAAKKNDSFDMTLVYDVVNESKAKSQ